MMGSIIGWLIAKGLSERLARVVAIGGLLALLAGAMGGVKCAYDRRLIDNHEARREAASAKADRKADAKAAVQRRADDARIAQEQVQLERVQANATSDMDRRLARHRCLRLQQAARRERRQPPACN